MKALWSSTQRSSGLLTRTLLWLGLLAASACAPQATPTLFIPPTAIPALLSAATLPAAATVPASPTAPSTSTPVPATPTPCTNDLKFDQDITIPDGTTVLPGETVDKQWLVTNRGSCSWGPGYRLKLMAGEPMGAVTEQALYPALAGTQATLRMVFTAPQDAGSHQGAWQAVAPDGTTFGEAIYIQVNVQASVSP